MKEIIEHHKCTGCGACKNVCPKSCVDMKKDTISGFLYPVIDEDKCVNCNKCKSVCPVSNTIMESEYEPKVYMGWSLDEEVHLNSTSGGVFSEIAKWVYSQNGYVAGAVYDDNLKVVHFISNNIEDLIRLRQSKYCQSDKGNIYSTIKNLLKENKLVLFVGTSCECQALKRVINQSTERLILCDLVCLGAASPKAYSAYLEELKNKYKSKITKLWFKNKNKGWDLFSTKIEFGNGRSYLKDRYDDAYMIGYAENQLFIRESCTNCYFRKPKHNTDFTLADFWGIPLEKTKKQKGVSLIFSNSDKSEKILEEIKDRMYLEQRTYEDAANISNPAIYSQPTVNPRSYLFYENLDKGFSYAVGIARKKRTVKKTLYIFALKSNLFDIYRSLKKILR